MMKMMMFHRLAVILFPEILVGVQIELFHWVDSIHIEKNDHQTLMMMMMMMMMRWECRSCSCEYCNLIMTVVP